MFKTQKNNPWETEKEKKVKTRILLYVYRSKKDRLHYKLKERTRDCNSERDWVEKETDRE